MTSKAESWQSITKASDTKMRFGLVGNPVSDSLYPALITTAINVLGIEGEYHSFAVPSADFENCVRHLADCGFLGLNITTPYKARAARLAERFYEVKHAVGVANVLLLKDGIFGMNTEVPAFQHPISHVQPDLALVLGSGPAARTAITGLLLNHWRVKVWNQNAMKSRLLSSVLKRMGDIELIPDANPAGCTLIVNATRLGMKQGDQPPVLWKNVKRGAIAYDFVYRRVATDFLRQASLRALQTIDGREILVEKAALAMEWWTGRQVPREPLRRAVSLPPLKQPRL